jgi:drug/metabolite transporter (DMT)-like permease
MTVIETTSLGSEVPNASQCELTRAVSPETATKSRARVLRADILMLIAAAVWGGAFVAQKASMQHIGPFLFTGIRFLTGGSLILAFLAWRHSRTSPLLSFYKLHVASGIRPGFVLGLALFGGATLQQIGVIWTSAGKGGFLTGLYVVIVPLLALIGGHRIGIGSWLGTILAAAGVYFISLTEQLVLEPGDGFVIAGAFLWALHVILVSRFTRDCEPVLLAALQFLCCGILSLTLALLFETFSLEAVRFAGWSLAYGSLMSVCIGYTLQVVAQKDAPPTHAAIILSMEAVFAALAGWWCLGEVMSDRATLGCILLFLGVIAAQLKP